MGEHQQQPQPVPMSGTLKEQRARFAKELQNNPELRQRFRQILFNEEGMSARGTTEIAETALNRAVIRNTDLATQLRWHGTEHNGYYQRGQGVGWHGTAAQNQQLDSAIERALAGSDVSRGATDNSSAGLARREEASGAFVTREHSPGHDTFSRPGSAEPELARRWQEWHDAVTAAPEKVVTVPHGTVPPPSKKDDDSQVAFEP